MKIAIASDHAGFELKGQLIDHLAAKELETVDLGPLTEGTVSYVDTASKVARAVQSEQADLGVLICGTGIGVSLAANKHQGIRAALCTNEYMARKAREHNDANILCLGARVVGRDVAIGILDDFLATDFAGGRHADRVNQITELEDEHE